MAKGGIVKKYKDVKLVPKGYAEEMKELQDKYRQIERWRGRIERGEKEGIPKHKDFLPWLERQEAIRDSLETVVIKKHYPDYGKGEKKAEGGKVKKYKVGGDTTRFLEAGEDTIKSAWGKASDKTKKVYGNDYNTFLSTKLSLCAHATP